MKLGTLRVSRWVLAPELALCFGPLALLWWDSLFGVSGIMWLSFADIGRFYLSDVVAVAAFAKLVAGATAGIAGPLGLVCALRQVLWGRGARTRPCCRILVGCPIIIGVVFLVANVASATALSAEWLGLYLLVVILPALGGAHLARLRRPVVTELATAG